MPRVTDASSIYAESAPRAECGGLYIDQFIYAERATDWRGNNNIAESIFEQMALERHPVPSWIVVGAGTGGTSATIGRYIRFRRVTTQLCVVDPQDSVFADYFASGDVGLACDHPSRIEGIGRQRVEPSFIREVIDRMERVDDASSLAAMRLATDRLGRSVGGSTGTNLCGAFRLIAEMLAQGQTGSVVTLICEAASATATATTTRRGWPRAGWTGPGPPGLGALPVDRVGLRPRSDAGLRPGATPERPTLGRNMC